MTPFSFSVTVTKNMTVTETMMQHNVNGYVTETRDKDERITVINTNLCPYFNGLGVLNNIVY